MKMDEKQMSNMSAVYFYCSVYVQNSCKKQKNKSTIILARPGMKCIAIKLFTSSFLQESSLKESQTTELFLRFTLSNNSSTFLKASGEVAAASS